MTKDKDRQTAAVPTGRLSRFARFGGLAGGIAGRAAVDSLRQVAKGKRPDARDILLTPSNAARVADELSRLRGAAMKVGQLMSMDAGDVIPPELADILARLRSDATAMPAPQLRGVLDRAWGKGWLHRFQRFDLKPIAAASIGQVHRAVTKDGDELAIKIQYPGVRDSIDSDVDNVMTLIKMSGLLPRGLEIDGLLAEAKQQLHQEADYRREAEYLAMFGDLLANDETFCVPRLYPALTTETVLAMSYEPGTPVEDLATAPKPQRDRVATALFDLVLRELFEYGVMQTDPNFANYTFDAARDKIVLLDFGAARPVPPEVQDKYRAMLVATIARDEAAVAEAATALGAIDDVMPTAQRDRILAIIDVATEPLRTDAAFDFGGSGLAQKLSAMGMEFAEDREFGAVPPADIVFIQRKIAGMFLLVTRLNACVPAGPMVQRWLDAGDQ